MGEHDWEDLDVTKHHNETYVIGRLPKEVQDQLNALLTMIAMTGRYYFLVEDAFYGDVEEFIFKWKTKKGTFEIVVKLNDELELVDLVFVGLIGPANAPQNPVLIDSADGKHSILEILEIAKNYV